MAIKRKPRGLKRKCRNMIARLKQETRNFPQPHTASGYWHLHLWVALEFVNPAAMPHFVRKLCVQTLLERTQRLTTLASPHDFSRVVVTINLPDVHASQLIVFFSESYFNSFFTRDSKQQKWTSLDNERSLAKEWSLQVPEGFEEKGFHEEVQEGEDYWVSNELWFFGQL
jgi:hypothetical protein